MPEPATTTNQLKKPGKFASKEAGSFDEPLVKETGQKSWQRPFIQTKLTVGAPDDPFEKEADAMADKIMRMPEGHFLPHTFTRSAGQQIQRQEEDNSTAEKPTKQELQQQPIEPDYLSLRTPFYDRNVPFLWDAGSALGIWQYNFNFFQRFGLSQNWAGKAANLTAPRFIDAQLKANNPKWWEITDRELNTTSIVGTLPLFSFDAGFSNWKPLPFLQKKAIDTTATASLIQRKCATCEQEEKLQPKQIAGREKSFLQTKADATPSVNNKLVAAINNTRGRGRALDNRTRSFMESRMGADFRGVNVHTGSDTSQMARELKAQAFTVGRDIYFSEGKFQPHSPEGKHLLTHELTHVVQQGATNAAPCL